MVQKNSTLKAVTLLAVHPRNHVDWLFTDRFKRHSYQILFPFLFFTSYNSLTTLGTIQCILLHKGELILGRVLGLATNIPSWMLRSELILGRVLGLATDIPSWMLRRTLDVDVDLTLTAHILNTAQIGRAQEVRLRPILITHHSILFAVKLNSHQAGLAKRVYSVGCVSARPPLGRHHLLLLLLLWDLPQNLHWALIFEPLC